MHLHRRNLAAPQYHTSQLVLPLPPETVNSFIDKFPALVLHKIK